MNILFITRKFPPIVGGMEVFAYELSKSLSQKQNITLIKWGINRRWSLIIIPILWIRAFFKLVKGDIDIIHVNDGILSIVGWSLSRLFRKPYVVVIHGLDITWNMWVYQKIIPKFINRANAVVAISQETYDQAIKRNINNVKLHYIPLGINDDIYNKINKKRARISLNIANNNQVLLNVGRLVKRKGVAWFCQNVMPDLTRNNPDILLLVVGEGIERKNIEKIIKSNSLKKYVRLLGSVDNQTKIAAYNASDIFVMPNIKIPKDVEGFGLVSLEAAVSAIPVIASNLEGIKDAIKDQKNGLLVTPGNRNDYLRKINILLEDLTLAREFGLKAREYTLKYYRWSVVADQYITIYNSIIK